MVKLIKVRKPDNVVVDDDREEFHSDHWLITPFIDNDTGDLYERATADFGLGRVVWYKLVEEGIDE